VRISIIIPCYNSAKYLTACMDSIFAQTFADFEVILIDDGSKDDTLAIAEEIALQDARVRVLLQENSGVAAARNLGLEHAKGEWVTFVDSDDLLPADALETLLSGANEETDMVVCAHETFDENGPIETVIPQSRWMDKNGEVRKRAICLRLIEGDCVLNIMCNKLHRRSLIEREHLRLTRGVRMAEDALFNLEAVLCGRKVAYVNRVAYRYRMHAASATQSDRTQEYEKHLPWLAAMGNMLLRRGVMESYFGAYMDSIALRLYKDGGVKGVMQAFNEKVLPLLPLHALDGKKMTFGAKLLSVLCRKGLYPKIYPLIYPFQVFGRKAGEIRFALAAKKEMPR